MQRSTQFKVILTTGLALFAMFFGAGNIIFPLQLGTLTGQHILSGLLGFILSGVGVPFLGLFAVAMYEGDYWRFFDRYGRVTAFIIATFLILIIGPLFATPRTEIVTYSTLYPALPQLFKNPYVFDLAYFGIVFLLVYKPSRVVEVIGLVLSPVKITAFVILIIVGLYTTLPHSTQPWTAAHTFNTAFTMGYNTMDLLGTFFVGRIAYQYIVFKANQTTTTLSPEYIVKMTLYACLIGAALISLVYIGLIFTAAAHAQALQNTPTEALIRKISDIVLGQYGSLFVGICVSFACLATAAALTAVTAEYFYTIITRELVSRFYCLLIVLVIMYMMAILGFEKIMGIAIPILKVLYPVLIVMCVINIAAKLKRPVSS